MGYHPETLAFDFPPYPGSDKKRNPIGRALYALKPWIGFDVWHIDPEKRGTGNRTDDSCGWFDRTPGHYADAVKYLLSDQSTMHEVRLVMARREPMPLAYTGSTILQLTSADVLSLTLMIATELELRRWWNGQDGKGGAHASFWLRTFTRKRRVVDEAISLALHPLDNLSHVEEPEQMIRLIAASLNRKRRPWWKHPRWHVHHWKVNFHITRNLKRMFQPCATCRKPLGFGYCPTDDGSGKLHHGDCLYGHAGGVAVHAEADDASSGERV